ncbi:hypothetical protein [Vibrio gazogenes]|nr:hypothetical protein [Vibrio gazogenes]
MLKAIIGYQATTPEGFTLAFISLMAINPFTSSLFSIVVLVTLTFVLT